MFYIQISFVIFKQRYVQLKFVSHWQHVWAVVDSPCWICLPLCLRSNIPKSKNGLLTHSFQIKVFFFFFSVIQPLWHITGCPVCPKCHNYFFVSVHPTLKISPDPWCSKLCSLVFNRYSSCNNVYVLILERSWQDTSDCQTATRC